jgi:hypothetical protein
MRSESRWGSVKGGKRDRSTGGTEQEEARAVMHSDIGITHCCVMREEQNGFEEVAGNCNQKKEKKAGCRRASSTQPSCHASYRSAAGGQAGSSAVAGCPRRASAQRQ